MITKHNGLAHRYGRFIRAAFFILILAGGLLALVLSAAGQEGSGTAVDADRAGGAPVAPGDPNAPTAGSNVWGNPLPEQINYQGQLVDNGGLPMSGVYTLTFNVLSGPPGYALLYSESQTVTTDGDGLFDVMIGAVQPGLRNALDGGDAWLEVVLNGELLAPRQPIGSVAYALYAQHLAGGTGSDSVIAGGRSNDAGGTVAVIGGGEANAAAGAGAVVGGGVANSASGDVSFVGSGFNNRATNAYGFVGGGSDNWVAGDFSAIGGGEVNSIFGAHATVGGGFLNNVNGTAGTVSGGSINNAFANKSTIVGGENNRTDGVGSFIGAGYSNTVGITGTLAVIGGGSSNSADGSYATIGGGQGNDLNSGANWATIGGGYANAMFDSFTLFPPTTHPPEYSTIGGGRSNVVLGPGATVGGGEHNTAYPSSTIGGGEYNTTFSLGTVSGGISNTASNYSFVGGGRFNEADYDFTVVAGGENNVTFRDGAAIGGGSDNFASGFYSTIPGGENNYAGGDHSLAAGREASAVNNYTFVWSGSSQPFTSTADSQFLVDAPGGLGVGTNAPQSQLHVLDTIAGTATSVSAHVVAVENDAGSNSDLLALNASNITNPGGSVNYITFFDDSGAIAAIEGNGGGGVAYNTSGADFAEYLPLHAGVAQAPQPGTVLGLVGDALDMETAVAQRVFVISTAPGFVGNTPGEDGKEGMALVAFIGQVSVRVRGPVQAGDLLVASGRNDGTAVATTAAQLTPALGNQIVGQALESSSGPGVSLVNTLVGQPHDAFWAARLETSETYWSTRLADTEAQLADLAARLEALEAANAEETGAANE